ncbi:MAG: hypothetical protein IT365_16665 [Candidatus Hydrogenedentes bacterium]|nr:hypothetical protein [Candidatus Hydrogenedentota bacterium]
MNSPIGPPISAIQDGDSHEVAWASLPMVFDSVKRRNAEFAKERRELRRPSQRAEKEPVHRFHRFSQRSIAATKARPCPQITQMAADEEEEERFHNRLHRLTHMEYEYKYMLYG